MFKISTKSEVDKTFCGLVIAFLQLIRYVTVTLTFDLGQSSSMSGQMVNPSNKSEDPTAIGCWVLGGFGGKGV